MNYTLYYPNFEPYKWEPSYDNSDEGIALMILGKTNVFLICDIYHYKYEDEGLVLYWRYNIKNKKYKIYLKDTISQYIRPFKGFNVQYDTYELNKGLTFEQGLAFYKEVDGSV